MSNNNLSSAKSTKNDEFYTQYKDITSEVDAYVHYDKDVFRDKTILLPCDNFDVSNFTKFFIDNFDKFGIKKLISTCYVKQSHGKMLVHNKHGENLVTELQGDGDFRSKEIKNFRQEADFVITNPPFSLYREFIDWIFEDSKKFLVIGNKNSITYKEIFPLVRENRLWSGATRWSGGMWFYTENDSGDLSNVASTWFTNIEHGRRHEPLPLMTMNENLEKSKHERIKKNGYMKYDNYNAIEVPFSDAIPSDYSGPMGVPVTFLEKYNPDKFQIIGATESEGKGFSNGLWDEKSCISQPMVNGKRVYKRIFIIKKDTCFSMQNN